MAALALPQHHAHPHVAAMALRAIAHLAAEFEANCRRFAAAGAPKEVRGWVDMGLCVFFKRGE